MSVIDWSPQPGGNAVAERSIPARDGMAGREFPEAIRGVMAKTAALALDQGGALVSQGAGNIYEISSFSGFGELKPGVMISFRADRDNTAAPYLNVDGHGSRPWLAADGTTLAAGAVQKGRLYTAAWQDDLPNDQTAWRMVGAVAVNGEAGAPGATIITRTVPPVSADGKDGDFFIEDRTATDQGRRMYGPKAGGVWPANPWPIEVASYTDVPGLNEAIGYRLKVDPAAPLDPSEVVRISAFAEAGDGGGAEFVYDPAPPDGAYTVQYAGRAYALVPSPTIRPSVFGAKGDGVSNDFAALSAYRAWAISKGEPFRLEGRTYHIGASSLRLDGLSIKVEPGARIKGNVFLSTDIDVDNELPIDFDDGTLRFTYTVSPRPRIDTRPIKAFLTSSAVSRRKLSLTSDWRPTIYVFPLNDTSAADPSASFDQHVYLWPNLAPGQSIRAAMGPALGGREVRWVWSSVGADNPLIGVAIQCTTGVAVLLCAGDDVQIVRREKVVGAAESAQAVSYWRGAATHDGWKPRNARWSYRISRNLRTFELLFNSVVVHRYKVPPAMGWIVEAGPCVFPTATGQTAAYSLTADDREHFVGAPALDVHAFGDSKAAAVVPAGQGGRFPLSWPHYLPAWLDGSAGVRVAALTNHAVAGTRVAEMRVKFDALKASAAWASATTIIVAGGVNDIIQGTGFQSVYDDYAYMSDETQKAGKDFIAVGPDDYYARALVTDGSGVAVGNSGNGGLIRSGIERMAAVYGCGYVDGESAIGLELADWRNGLGLTPPRIVDNLHGADLYAAQMAFVIAQEVMRLTFLPAKGGVTGLTLPASAGLGGYAFAPSSTVDRSADGLITLDLLVTAGAYGDAFIALLPRTLWPKHQIDIPVQYEGQRGVVQILGPEDGAAVGYMRMLGLAASAPTKPVRVLGSYPAAFA